MYDQSKLELIKSLGLIKSKIEFLNSIKAKPESIVWLEFIYANIVNYIDESDQLIENKENPYIEIIKKQALIIEISGIKFPTINQHIDQIYDILLVTKGRPDLVGEKFNQQVIIPVI